ncbi:hypothetical protein ACLB2K_001231 [Fragaria x ananassa]
MSALLPTFCSATPHFFKIILDNTSRDIKLKIPKKFVKKYGEHLSDSVCLKIPSGCEWEVGVTRNGNKVWFEQGWPAFAKFYSLDYGVFLLFRYEGNSKFQVCIFDTSATEIAYPIRIEEPDNINCEDIDDDSSYEALDDFSHPYCPKTRAKSPLPSPRPHKRRQISSNSEGKIQGKTDIIGKEHGGGSFSTQNVRKETPKNLRGSFVKNFATQHQLVKLQVGDRSWPVKLNIYHKGSSIAKLSGGWPAFCQENSLSDGDVCIFELIQVNDVVLKVHIFRC